MIPETILSLSQLVSAVEKKCSRNLDGLGTLLRAVLQLSTTSEEDRFPRLNIHAQYKEVVPMFIEYTAALSDLAKVAQTVPYPDFALTCIWRDGEWTISGITQATLAGDGLIINVNGPMNIAICLPNQLVPYIEIVHGNITICDQAWEAALARLGHTAKPIASLREGSMSALTIGKAIYKVSIGGHGGTFLVLPRDPSDCIDDLSFGHPAKLGFEFERLQLNYGHPDSRRIDECSKALAAIASVDGAVVFSSDLSLLGFNATILTQ